MNIKEPVSYDMGSFFHCFTYTDLVGNREDHKRLITGVEV